MSFARLISVSALLTLLVPAAAPFAAGASKESFYRCRDAGGQVHYGDSKPRQCEGFDTEVLNANGMVMRVIEGTQSRVEREKREVGEKRIRQEREAKLQHDRMLMETYLTVEDIERLRDQRLELLDAQYRITEQNITNLRDRQQRLTQQIARFAPYNDKPNAPPLPDHLAEEMVNTVNGMRVYQETLTKTRKEQGDIKDAFTADIARFKELKGIK